jgi:hypothetical protein
MVTYSREMHRQSIEKKKGTTKTKIGIKWEVLVFKLLIFNQEEADMSLKPKINSKGISNKHKIF